MREDLRGSGNSRCSCPQPGRNHRGAPYKEVEVKIRLRGVSRPAQVASSRYGYEVRNYDERDLENEKQS